MGSDPLTIGLSLGMPKGDTMSASKSASLLAALAMGAAVVAYFTLQSRAPQTGSDGSAEVPPSQVAPPATLPIAPSIRHPIESAPAAAAEPPADPAELTYLPALDASDAAVARSLDPLLADGGTRDLLLLNNIVRRIVATVDNLPGERISSRLSPVRFVGGGLIVDPSGDGFVIGEQNARRYAPYVRLAETVDLRYLASLYARFYPLFQQAYEELGYPNRYFNDRLVAVLDHLLATPDPESPIRVVQPKVLYQFADPELEALSAGQKILLRMGAENRARVKAQLREFRGYVAGE